MAWRIVFVCTGNICRSPTAEAVLRRKAAERGRLGRGGM
jgi:protein-tyrosine phosphatase